MASLAVNADAERVMQVLSNLVGNALKFVPRGGNIVLKCERRETEAAMIVIDALPLASEHRELRLTA